MCQSLLGPDVERLVCVHAEIIIVPVPLDLGNRYILFPWRFSTSVQPILNAGNSFCLQVFPPRLAPFHWQELITGAYESEMNDSVKVWMWGRDLRACREQGCMNSSPGADEWQLITNIFFILPPSTGFSRHCSGKLITVSNSFQALK